MKNKTQNTIHDIFASYFQDTSIQRLAYTVSKKLEEGHICLDLDLIDAHSKDDLDIKSILSSPYLTRDVEQDLKPFVLHNNKIYLQRYFYYETHILNKISELIQQGKKNRDSREKTLLELKDMFKILFPPKHEDNLDRELIIPWQMIAVFNVILNNFAIITGGPGTGKTTTITKLLALLFAINPKTSVAIAAPTGKAAARLNESISNGIKNIKSLEKDVISKFVELKAQTIHRLLGVNIDSTVFTYNNENKLQYDIVIIDESSMIDVTMMSKLLEAIPANCRLVLLGDKDQLSSIEAGSIFGDLCNSQNPINSFCGKDIDLYNNIIENDSISIPQSYIAQNPNILTGSIIELKRSYRFKNDEGIGKFSNLVIRGKSDFDTLIEPFQTCKNDMQCVKVTQDYDDPGFIEMINKYEDYINEPDMEKALGKINIVKVLCAVKEGEYGVKQYNSMIENHLKSRGLIKPKAGFYHNQIIMISSNDYSLGLFNGDIGIVREESDTGNLKVYFQNENNILSYPVSNINRYNTVFAMTIHKSQGSEFNNIVIVLPKKTEHKLISRELIYTAVTRAKTNALVISDYDILLDAVQNKTQRVSGIVDRISGNNI